MTEQLMMDAESIFSTLPSPREREYEKTISKYAENADNPECIAVLNRMANGASQYDFEAFFCLSIIYRRKKDFILLKRLLDEHPQFRKHLCYNHIYIAYLVHSESFFDYDELLLMAYRDALAFPDHSGFQQAFCNAFVTIAEQCDESGREAIINEWYDSALACINASIDLDSKYAKYYCTKGRILAQRGRFAEAIELINMAISLEKSSRPDYALVLQTYENFKTRIMIRSMSERYVAKIDELQARIDELERKTGIKKEADSIDADFASDKESGISNETSSLNKRFAFVSYAHSDSTEVVELIRELSNHGMNLWYDAYIPYGSEWPEEIGNHIVASSLVIVMLSATSMCSANVRREVNLALSSNKPLLIIRLDEVNLSPGMRLQFEMYQMIDKSAHQRDRFLTVLENAVIKGLSVC